MPARRIIREDLVREAESAAPTRAQEAVTAFTRAQLQLPQTGVRRVVRELLQQKEKKETS